MRAALAIAVLLGSAALAEAPADSPGEPDAGTGAEAAPEGLPPARAPDAGVEPPPADAPVAPPPADEPAPEELAPKRAEANGYVLGRVAYTRPRLWGMLSTAEVPQLSLLLEVNAQVKFKYWRESKVYGDVSLIGQAGFIYRMLDAEGVEVDAPAKDVLAVRPLVSINELYVHQETVPALTFTVGKKRVVWGSGFAYSPTDILNLRRDPTDPTGQRAGVWLAQAQVSLERLTFDLVFSPAVLKSAYGIPYQLAVYPEWDKQDDQLHYQLAARAGALIWDTDLNLLVFFGNKYNDAFENKFRVGGSVSRVFFNSTEVHAELLVQSGSARQYFNPSCVGSALEAIACGIREEPFISRPLLDDPALRPTVLGGVRHTFPDDSILSLEYLFQADGYRPDQFQDQVNALDLLQQAAAAGIPLNRIPGAADLLGQGAGGEGVPQRLSFQPTAKHYAFLSYMKGQIFHDFTAQLVTVVNLQDLSTLWTPSVQWSATEWLTLGVYGFFPLPGPDALAATVPSTGKPVSEYSLLPMSWRAFLEARVYY